MLDKRAKDCNRYMLHSKDNPMIDDMGRLQYQNWVYSLIWDKTEMKVTHVLHRPTGHQAAMATEMPVDSSFELVCN
eukprot:4226300-Lingulodinium_polyedra.AAC.1